MSRISYEIQPRMGNNWNLFVAVVYCTVLLFIQTVESRTEGYTTDLHYLCRDNDGHGLIGLEWDCTGYVQCNFRYAIWINCPDNLVFTGGGCNIPPNSGYCTDPILRAETFCPKMPELKFPHPKSCSMYYDCRQTVPQMGLAMYENECQFPKLFDKYDLMCKFPDEVKNCGRSPRPKERCDYTLECLDRSCKGFSDGPNPIAQKLYQPDYLLCKAQLVLGKPSCAEGEVFDPVQLRCSNDIADSMRTTCGAVPLLKIASHLSCAKYYDCQKQNWHPDWPPYLTECPYFQLFDPIRRQCLSYTSVNCGERPEPKAPCDYEIGHCSTGQCIPCEATCIGKPDGDTPYPGSNRDYMSCQSERTIRIESCTGTRLFYQGRCQRASDVPANAFDPTTTTTTTTVKTTIAAATPPPPTPPPATPPPPTPPPQTPPPETPPPPTPPPPTPPPETPPPPTPPPETPPPSSCEANQPLSCSADTRLRALEEQLKLINAGGATTDSCSKPPNLDSLTGMVVSLEYEQTRTLAKYTCKPGFSLCGSEEPVVCEQGTWDQPSVSCARNTWGQPLVPNVVNVECPLRPWSSIAFLATLTTDTEAVLSLVDLDDTNVFDIKLLRENNGLRISFVKGSETLATQTKAVYNLGDQLHIAIMVGFDEYAVLIDGVATTTIPFNAGPHTVERISKSEALVGNLLQIKTPKLTQLTSSATFEDSALVKGDNFLTFGVQSACNGATIFFSPSKTANEEASVFLYMGRKLNEETAVRTPVGNELRRIQHPAPDCNSFRYYWVNIEDTVDGSYMDIGTGFGMNPDSILFSALPVPQGMKIQAVFVQSRGPASWLLSHPAIEHCGTPELMGLAVPELSYDQTSVKYRCLTGEAMCGTSSTMTCGKDRAWQGMHGSCVKSQWEISSDPNLKEKFTCQFKENAAISFIVTMGSQPLSIQLSSDDSSKHLNVRMTGNKREFIMANPTNNFLISDATNLAPGTEYHVVIYKKVDSFDLYVDGNFEHSLQQSTNSQEISHFHVSGHQGLAMVEFAPEVAAFPTCANHPFIANKVAVKQVLDTSFGTEYMYNCDTNYVPCDSEGIPPHKVRCSSDGTWRGKPTRCVRNTWNTPGDIKAQSTIPYCFATTGGVRIIVDVNLLSGSFKTLKMFLNDGDWLADIGIQLDFDAKTYKLLPDGTEKPLTVSGTTMKVSIVIDGSTITYLPSVQVDPVPSTAPVSSFHALTTYTNNVDITSIRILPKEIK